MMIRIYKETLAGPIKMVAVQLVMLLAPASNAVRAQAVQAAPSVAAAAGCMIAGADTVNAGSTASYTLSGCSAGSWTASCGTITDHATGSVTVSFSVTGCSSVVITATSGGAALATKKVAVVPATALTAGTIAGGSQTVNYNSIAKTLTAPAATGGICGGSYSYQWLSSTDSLNFSAIPGATGQNYQPGPMTTTTWFKRQASCGGNVLLTSNTAKIVVNLKSEAIVLSPASQSVNPGELPVTISLSSASNGGSSYLWQQADNAAFTGAIFINGAGSISYSPGPLHATTYYRVAMTANGDTLYSAPALVQVYPALSGGSINPATQTINSSGVSEMLSAGGAGGSNGVFTYQWYSSTDNIHWILMEGVTVQNYYPGAPPTTTWYRVEVSSNGLTVTSAPAVVNVTP